MKNLKAILVTTLASLFAVLTVVNMSLANPKSAGENTLDMLEIMTRAFDESEGGEADKPNYCWTNVQLGGIGFFVPCNGSNPEVIPSTICGTLMWFVTLGQGAERKQCHTPSS